MTDLQKRIIEIRKNYGDYLTQEEFLEAAGISPRTARLATKNGLVPYTVEYIGSTRYYRIKTEDVAKYMEKRFSYRRMGCCGDDLSAIETILSTEPDVLSIRNASLITGIHKNSIERWIQQGYLTAFRWKNVYRITKSELIKYIASPRFWKARSKSLQREAMRMAMEWLETQREKAYDRKDL